MLAAVLARLRSDLPDWRVPVPAGGLSIWAGLPEARSSLLVPAAAALVLAPALLVLWAGVGRARDERVEGSATG